MRSTGRMRMRSEPHSGTLRATPIQSTPRAPPFSSTLRRPRGSSSARSHRPRAPAPQPRATALRRARAPKRSPSPTQRETAHTSEKPSAHGRAASFLPWATAWRWSDSVGQTCRTFRITLSACWHVTPITSARPSVSRRIPTSFGLQAANGQENVGWLLELAAAARGTTSLSRWSDKSFVSIAC